MPLLKPCSKSVPSIRSIPLPVDPAKNLLVLSSSLPSYCFWPVKGRVVPSWRLVAAIRPSARLWEDSGYTRRAQHRPSSAASQRVSPFPSAASPGLVYSAAPLTTCPSISHLTFQLVAGTLGKTKWGKGGLCVTSSYWATPLSLPFPPTPFPPSFLMTATEKLLLTLPQLLLGYRTW